MILYNGVTEHNKTSRRKEKCVLEEFTLTTRLKDIRR